MAKLALVCIGGLIALSLLGCGAGDLVEEQGLPVPVSAREVRAQNEIDDFHDALRHADWERVCSHLTAEGYGQMVRHQGAPLSTCPAILKAGFHNRPVEGPDAKVTEATPTSGQDIQVKTDTGERLTLDSQYRIVHYFPPQ
jgi:hypothetical protein